MFKLLWKWLVSVFTVDKIGILVRTILLRAGSKIASDILNPDFQEKAYQYVRELNKRSDLTNAQKARQFNRKLLLYAKSVFGKQLKESVVNCLRELAVNALKAQRQI